jgi:hypothetical protein
MANQGQIREYHSSLHVGLDPHLRPTQTDNAFNLLLERAQELRGRGRPPKLSMISIICIMFLLEFGLVHCNIKLTGDYKYCQLQSKVKVDENSCIPKKQKQEIRFPELVNTIASNNVVTQQVVDLQIVRKLHSEVSGIGIRCKKEIITDYYNTYFFTGREPPIFEFKNVELSKADCENMISTQVCEETDGTTMNCESEGNCVLTKNPVEAYSWPHKVTTRGLKCSLSKVPIEGERNKTIFGRKCKPDQGFCILESFTVVWNSSIIHECPYESVVYTDFKWVTPSIIRSDKQKLAFELLEPVVACKTYKLYSTTVGLFVTKVKLRSSTHLKEKSETLNLLLSDSDYSKLENINSFSVLNRRACYVNMNMLQLYKKTEDKFFKLRDIDSNEAIFYSNYGQIFVPICFPVTSIQIINESKNCFEDIPIQFTFENRTRQGFLEDGIIRQSTHVVDCNKNTKFLFTKIGTLVRIGNKVSLANFTLSKQKISIMNQNISDVNLRHKAIVIEEEEVIEDMFGTEQIAEEHGKVFVKRSAAKVTKVTKNPCQVNESSKRGQTRANE